MDTYTNNPYNYEKEVKEAIAACDNVLYHLEQADAYLSSAGNWGIVDILGGGMLSTFAKHSKMDKAEQEIQNAKNAIRILKKELQDVGRLENIELNTNDFLSFADFFFDGFVADWLVQSKIRKAKEQIDLAVSQVKELKLQLSRYI